MSEILINTSTAGVQHQPALAAFRIRGSAAHLFFAAWKDAHTLDIKGQLLTATGAGIRNEFLISTSTRQRTRT
jgi:hypothetical protein